MRRRHGPQPRHPEAGFTFLELVAVLIILAILTSSVVPMFHDSIMNLRRESAIENVAATMKYAQERAIVGSIETRFCMDLENNDFWVVGFTEYNEENKPVFAPLSEAAGKRHKLPESLAFQRPKARRVKGQDVYFISFYPGGACDVAEVRIRHLEGRSRRDVTIETEGRLGQFDIEGLE